MKNNEIFVKNWLSVKVDALGHRNRYIVYAMYDVIKTDENGEYAEIANKVIEDVTLTWDEIEADGGIEQLNKDLKECYGV